MCVRARVFGVRASLGLPKVTGAKEKTSFLLSYVKYALRQGIREKRLGDPPGTLQGRNLRSCRTSRTLPTRVIIRYRAHGNKVHDRLPCEINARPPPQNLPPQIRPPPQNPPSPSTVDDINLRFTFLRLLPPCLTTRPPPLDDDHGHFSRTTQKRGDSP